MARQIQPWCDRLQVRLPRWSDRKSKAGFLLSYGRMKSNQRQVEELQVRIGLQEREYLEAPIEMD